MDAKDAFAILIKLRDCESVVCSTIACRSPSAVSPKDVVVTAAAGRMVVAGRMRFCRYDEVLWEQKC